jgi:hypothetical protein
MRIEGHGSDQGQMSCAAATNSLRAVVVNAESRLLWPIGMRIAQQLQSANSSHAAVVGEFADVAQ